MFFELYNLFNIHSKLYYMYYFCKNINVNFFIDSKSRLQKTLYLNQMIENQFSIITLSIFIYIYIETVARLFFLA